ncbi:MAG: hypothetical protein WCH43_13925 [Verrucomicrobiota bacterium]
MNWTNKLELNADRQVVSGSPDNLRHAIRSGADLRIYTAFRNNEHLDTASENSELVDEVSEFRTTYLIDDRWVAGLMTTRMPVAGPSGFGPRPSMSYFLYNEDGGQAISRLYLDGASESGEPAEHPARAYPDMPKYKEGDRWDDNTNAPSSNFFYSFERFRFFTNPSWTEVFAHDKDGHERRGSLDALVDAFRRGCEIKVGVEGLCEDLASESLPHVVFVPCGPGYYHTESRVFYAGSHPTVRVAPAIPMVYRSRNWDCGSLFVRSDGFVEYWRRDPYTLAFSKHSLQLGLRWFVR